MVFGRIKQDLNILQLLKQLSMYVVKAFFVVVLPRGSNKPKHNTKDKKGKAAEVGSAVVRPIDSVVDGRQTADDLLSHAPPYLAA